MVKIMALARERIIEAALKLLDEGGIDNVTTRKLAGRLKVQQPALYWHFRSKQDLLDALGARIMAEGHTRRTPRRGETWQVFVAANARSFRRALLAHRDGARVHAGTKPSSVDVAGLEAQLEVYLRAGFGSGDALEAGIAIGRYVVGCVLEEQADEERRFDPADFLEEFAAYPALYAALRQYAAMPAGAGNDHAFEAGLGLIVAGLERRLDAISPRKKKMPSARRKAKRPAKN